MAPTRYCGIFQSTSFPRDCRVDRNDMLVELGKQPFEPAIDAFRLGMAAGAFQLRNASFHFDNDN